MKEKMVNLVVLALELIVGVLLLINPVGFTSAVIKIAGIVLLIVGAFQIVKYFGEDPVEALVDQSLAIGLITVSLGLFCIFGTDWFISTFPVLSVVYGVAVLISGFMKTQWTVDSLRLHNGNWLINMISAILSIVFAIIIIKNPFATTTILWKFTGIILIIEAILDIIIVATTRSVEE